MIFNGAKMVQTLFGSIQVSPVTRINMGYIYFIIPFGFSLMSFRIIQNMWKRKLTFSGSKETPTQIDHEHAI
jgi:C4-dicarboxylate transporter, DctQ subunit